MISINISLATLTAETTTRMPNSFVYCLENQLVWLKLESLYKMVIYSGFSTRRQEQKYNQLVKELLHLLSQMIITYIESAKISTFRQAYEKLQIEFVKMDQHKYSDIKISVEIEPLTQHMLYEDFIRETISEPPKKKHDGRHIFRMKKSNMDHFTAKTIQINGSQQREDKRRSFSNTSDKNINRYQMDEQPIKELTMEDLMRLNPMIQRKMSGFRKKRYLQAKNNFPQIKEEDYQGEQKD